MSTELYPMVKGQHFEGKVARVGDQNIHVALNNGELVCDFDVPMGCRVKVGDKASVTVYNSPNAEGGMKPVLHTNACENCPRRYIIEFMPPAMHYIPYPYDKARPNCYAKAAVPDPNNEPTVIYSNNQTED